MRQLWKLNSLPSPFKSHSNFHSFSGVLSVSNHSWQLLTCQPPSHWCLSIQILTEAQTLGHTWQVNHNQTAIRSTKCMGTKSVPLHLSKAHFECQPCVSLLSSQDFKKILGMKWSSNPQNMKYMNKKFFNNSLFKIYACVQGLKELVDLVCHHNKELLDGDNWHWLLIGSLSSPKIKCPQGWCSSLHRNSQRESIRIVACSSVSSRLSWRDEEGTTLSYRSTFISESWS